MPIIISDQVSGRGKRDARRHREKQRDLIKKQLPHIIAEESIITRNLKGKTIKIPIKSIEIPKFVYGNSGQALGVGQGPGERGDVIGRRPGQAGPGAPGTEPGEDYLETEIDIEEIIEMMYQDLGLPLLEQKAFHEILVEMGFKVKGRQKTGPWVLIDRPASAKEGIRRFWFFLRHLERETGKDGVACFWALKQTNGILVDALKLLQDPAFSVPNEITEVAPFPIFYEEDLRFRKVVPNFQYQSNAILIAMMDVSGSMNESKKYLARSMLFWLTNFLRKLYNNVVNRFIVHTTEAHLVDEDAFFRTGESGGTACYSAYELANGLIDTEYPTDNWNVYVWHFSDGEDGEIARTIEEIKKMMAKTINMLGYGEIRPQEGLHFNFSGGLLYKSIHDAFSLKETQGELRMISGDKDLPILGIQIEKKENVWPALREFLRKDRWASNE